MLAVYSFVFLYVGVSGICNGGLVRFDFRKGSGCEVFVIVFLVYGEVFFNFGMFFYEV